MESRGAPTLVEAGMVATGAGRRRHRAALDFGDCLADATARHAGDPLLFVGGFARTDVIPA
jgi:uncharacterized protein with PIN domain